jgi:hypothetical protein
MTLLRHVEGDRFRTIRDNGDDGHEIRFIRDASGRVTHMNVHSLNLPRIGG